MGVDDGRKSPTASSPVQQNQDVTGLSMTACMIHALCSQWRPPVVAAVASLNKRRSVWEPKSGILCLKTC